MTHTKEMIAVDQQCLCGHPSCDRWGLSNGTFVQGTGFSRKDAERLAACWNAMVGLNPDAVADVVAALEPVAGVTFLSNEIHYQDDDLVMVSVGTVRAARTALARIRGEG